MDPKLLYNTQNYHLFLIVQLYISLSSDATLLTQKIEPSSFDAGRWVRRGSQIFWAGHEPSGAAWWIPHRPPSSRIRNRPHISRNTCAATNSSGWHSNFLSSLIILISKHDGNDPIISLTNLLANKKPMTCYVYHIYWYRANKYVCNSLDPYRCVLSLKKEEVQRDRKSESGSHYDGLPRSGPLRPPFVEFNLVHGPDCSFDVLHSHETFVQRQVVTNRILIYIFLNFTYGETTKTLLCPIFLF